MRLAGKQDFIGINYYSAFGVTRDLPRTELGWTIFPDGLYQILKRVTLFKLPIYVTENGISDVDDDQRESFIVEHIKSISRALNKGADVRGYFYWSLMDNFEWARGFNPRFGLVEVDYKTMKRTIRPSAWVYARIAKANALE